MAGYGDGTWRPAKNVTRGFFADLVYRLAGKPNVWSAWPGDPVPLWRFN